MCDICQQNRENAPPTTITYHSQSDGLGRCTFTLCWTDPDGRKRAQVFHADPRKHGFPRPEDGGSPSPHPAPHVKGE